MASRPSPAGRTSSVTSYISLAGSHSDAGESSVSLGSEDSWEAEQRALAQAEWEEGLKQLELAVRVMVLPFFGKWMGRKWAYWIFTRYQTLGLSASLFGVSWLAPLVPTSALPGPVAVLVGLEQ